MHSEDHRDYTDQTIDHMEQFAKQGFRTMVLAYRVISEDDYQVCFNFLIIKFIKIKVHLIFLSSNYTYLIHL